MKGLCAGNCNVRMSRMDQNSQWCVSTPRSDDPLALSSQRRILIWTGVFLFFPFLMLQFREMTRLIDVFRYTNFWHFHYEDWIQDESIGHDTACIHPPLQQLLTFYQCCLICHPTTPGTFRRQYLKGIPVQHGKCSQCYCNNVGWWQMVTTRSMVSILEGM